MGSSKRNDETEQEPRDRGATESSASGKRTISGPGAADFIASPGGLDTPDSDAAQGTRAASEEGSLTDARRLTPDLDEPSATTERAIESLNDKKP
jgi:hypothetical protein